VRAVLVARRGALRRQAALGDAEGVRRPCRDGHSLVVILAGDIGGTNTRLALVDGDPRAPLAVEVYPSRAHGSFEEMLAAFLAAHPARLDRVCVAVAGPVIHGHVDVTNLA